MVLSPQKDPESVISLPNPVLLIKKLTSRRLKKLMFICTQFIDQLPVGLLAQLVDKIFFRSYLQLLVSVVILAARIF